MEEIRREDYDHVFDYQNAVFDKLIKELKEESKEHPKGLKEKLR